MKSLSIKYLFITLIILISALLTLQYCAKKQVINNTNNNQTTKEEEGLKESYKKIGWLDDNKYRTGVYILTMEECSTSNMEQINDRIKMESFKHLQKELNPSFNRNTAVQIKNLIDNYGKVISTTGNNCLENNIFIFDIEKKELKSDFINIKNSK